MSRNVRVTTNHKIHYSGEAYEKCAKRFVFKSLSDIRCVRQNSFLIVESKEMQAKVGD